MSVFISIKIKSRMKLRFVKVSMQGMLLITDKVFGTARDRRTDTHRSCSTAVSELLLLFGLCTEQERKSRDHNVPHQTLS